MNIFCFEIMLLIFIFVGIRFLFTTEANLGECQLTLIFIFDHVLDMIFGQFFRFHCCFLLFLVQLILREYSIIITLFQPHSSAFLSTA